MRLLISFFLTLIIYSGILAFLYFILIPHKKEEKKVEVLIHTAVSAPKSPVKKKVKKEAIKVEQKQEIVQKTETKKLGSKSAFTQGGDIDFNDIFKNVKANVPTTPLKFKKNLIISRFKGLNKLQKKLNNIKSINFKVTFNGNNSLKKENVDEIIQKIGQIWDEISNLPGEYAKINVISTPNGVRAVILESNLDSQKQQMLIQKIESLNFEKNFNLNILFQTKVGK